MAEDSRASRSEGVGPGSAQDRLALAGVGGLLLAGAAVRVWAARSELWLDEVWSLVFAGSLESPLGVLTQLHHDNNHHLNTWYLAALGEPRSFLLYRLHSLAAGVAAIALGCAWLRPRGRAGVLLGALLLGSSYPLVHYASEARGYALLVAFAFASLLATRRFLARPDAPGALLYALCAVAGFLAHLSFAHVFAGIAAWTAVALARGSSRPADAALRWLGYHALPALALAGLWLVDLRHLTVGGGPDYALADVLVTTLSYAVGGPAAGAGAALAGAAAVLACAAALAVLAREGRSEWIAFAVAVFVSPALALWIREPEILFPRYFLVSVALGLLLLAELGARVAARGRLGAGVVAALALAFAVANGAHVATLLRDGRGGLRAALLEIARLEPDARIRVGAVNERLGDLMLTFYARYLPPGRELEVVDHEAWSDAPPSWALASYREPQPRAPGTVELMGRPYVLLGYHDTAPLSGHAWLVYRLERDL